MLNVLELLIMVTSDQVSRTWVIHVLWSGSIWLITKKSRSLPLMVVRRFLQYLAAMDASQESSRQVFPFLMK